MISRKLEDIINHSIRLANLKRHEYLTLELVLFSLLKEDGLVVKALKECGADTSLLSSELESFLNDDSHFSVLSDEKIKSLGKKQFIDEELRRLAGENGIHYQPEISMALQRIIQRAALHVQSSGKRQIRGVNLLVAMFQEKESFALYLLAKYGIERLDFIEKISHREESSLITKTNNNEEEPVEEKKYQALHRFTQDLELLAKEEQIDPLIGREKEVTRISQILCRRRKNNPLLVGEAGVGKTAIIRGLAHLIFHKKVPSVLENSRIFALDIASLLAGAKYRGDFEQRFKAVVDDLTFLKKEGVNPILLIDEIHTVMGAGSTTGSSLDASNLLKPILGEGSIRCIGSTTYEEYRKFVEKDAAFARRFQKVDVHEPDQEETLKILEGLKPKFEDYHGVKYGQSVLKFIVEMSDRYITDKKNPDKSIDVIDELGASMQILPPSQKKIHITKKDVEHTVGQIARIPKVQASKDQKEDLKNLAPKLKLLIFGQDQAIEMVSSAVWMAKSGLRDAQKPLGSFLFMGPTGVGKTELARQLALELDCHLERFDMSEYMEKHTVARLIGSPPGYVGHESGGLLTDAIEKNPHGVLLLDEIEKAHPDLFNILLQIMDYGRLTDAQGRVSIFKNVILIMTSNVGARESEMGQIGLQKGGRRQQEKALKNTFSPEFRNRLDAIIPFSPLSEELIIKVVDKFLIQLEEKLLPRKIELDVDLKTKKWLAKEGFDSKMGARPMERLIDQEIKRPLSSEILFGKLEKGGIAEVRLNEKTNKIVVRAKLREKMKKTETIS